ncbi:MAG: 50S ribosomal protein L30 [Deltaproteobacteria bacterium]|nr:50S ribosomal protein L30 [Deltaproteobacteria bacterium]
MLKVTLKRSPIGQTTRQRDSLRGLGLTRVGRTVIVRESDQVRGLIRKVLHLIEVES